MVAFLWVKIMATPCRMHKCKNLVTKRSMLGYCDEHADQRHGWAKTQAVKGNTTQRGYGYAWRQIRKQVLERDCYLCQVCKAAGRLTEATAVDHIINKAHGGTDSKDNLQAICKSCHDKKTQMESQKGRGG